MQKIFVGRRTCLCKKHPGESLYSLQKKEQHHCKIDKETPYPDVLPEMYFQQFSLGSANFKTLSRWEMPASSGILLPQSQCRATGVQKRNPKHCQMHTPYFNITTCPRRHFPRFLKTFFEKSIPFVFQENRQRGFPFWIKCVQLPATLSGIAHKHLVSSYKITSTTETPKCIK